MKNLIAALAAFTLLTTSIVLAAPAASPSPVASAAASVVIPVTIAPPAGSVIVSPTDFFSQVMVTIQKFGGAPTMLKIALVILLIVSSMKVSFLNQLFWSKLGAAQAWIAPLLGLIAGILDLAGSGQLSLASLAAYVSAGAGAIILHELLDGLKSIPGLGAMWVNLIDLISKNLGAKPVAEPAPVVNDPKV